MDVDIGVTRDRTVDKRKLLGTLRNYLEPRTRESEKDHTIKNVFWVKNLTSAKENVPV